MNSEAARLANEWKSRCIKSIAQRLTIYAIGYSLNFADTQTAGNLTAHVTTVSALMFQ